MKITSITIGHSVKRVVNYQSVESNMSVTVELAEGEKPADAFEKYQPALIERINQLTWAEAERIADDAFHLGRK